MTEKPLTYLIRKTKPTIKEDLSGIGIRFKVYKDEKEVLEIKSVWNAWEVEYGDKCPLCNSRFDEFEGCACDSQGD